jgi:hypothetical protein
MRRGKVFSCRALVALGPPPSGGKVSDQPAAPDKTTRAKQHA